MSATTHHEVDDATSARARRISHMAVWILTASWIMLCTTWSILVPPLKSPDEAAHLSAALMLAEGWSWPDLGDARQLDFVTQLEAEELPLTGAERSTVAELEARYPGFGDTPNQMTQHPPTYYLLAAGVFHAIDYQQLRWDQVLLGMRLLGVLLAAPIPWLVFGTVRTVTRSRAAAVVGVTALWLVPGMTQLLAMGNNDTLAILVGAAIAWLSARIWTGDRRVAGLLSAGVVLGIAGLVKGTLIVFAIPVVVALLFGRAHPPHWGARLRETLWPLAVALVCGQWWWLRNLVVYGTLQPYGSMLDEGSWPPGAAPDPVAFAAEFWRVATTTFWGWFGRVNAPLPAPLVLILTIGGVALIVAGFVRASGFRRITIAFLLIPAGLALVLMVRVSWGAYVDTAAFRGMHGRYFYPVVTSLIAASAIAAMSLVRRRRGRVLFGIAIATVSAAMAALGPIVTFVHFYAPGAVGVRAAIGAWAEGMSPLPAGVSLAIAGIALVLGAVGLGFAIRAIVILPPSRRSGAAAAALQGTS